MRSNLSSVLVPLVPAALGVPATVLEVLPLWALLTLTGIGVLLTAAQVVVTQVIRLRASVRSRDALRVLELEERSRRRGRPT